MPRPLSFKEIEAFRAVMQTGTTTAAAQLLHTTQPSISRLLAQMQTSADLKLFDMHKGGCARLQRHGSSFRRCSNIS
jgi:DNA-binding transcriptional LysR family regulator